MALLLIAILMAASLPGASFANTGRLVCKTDDCKKAAEAMQSKMDDSVDPCDDFFRYTCGAHLKKPLPKSKGIVGSLYDFTDQDLAEKKVYLEQDPGPDSWAYEVKMKSFYKQCIDTGRIEADGIYLFSGYDKHDWPTLTRNAPILSFQAIMEKYERDHLQVFYEHDLTVHKSGNESINILEMSQPYAATHVKGFVKHYTSFAQKLGADANIAQSDGEKVLALIEALNKQRLVGGDVYDPLKTTNVRTLEQLNKEYSYFDWVRIYTIILQRNKDTRVTSQTKINVVNTNLLRNLEGILQKATARTVQNLFAFRFAEAKIGGTTEAFRRQEFEFNQPITGLKEPKPQWEKCVKLINIYFHIAITKVSSIKNYTPAMKTSMTNMITRIKGGLEESFNNAKWMSAATRERNLLKLKNIKSKIGIWDQNWTDKYMDELYENFEIRDNFAGTRFDLRRSARLLWLRNVNKPVEDWTFTVNMATVNANADPLTPQIIFRLPIMRSPFYSGKNPAFMNYASIGYVIGHEILHIFDKSGRKYDENGISNDFWQQAEKEEYEKRATCYAEMYNGITIKQINKKVKGTEGLGEIIADNAGAREAYKAYQEYGKTNPELPLDVYNLSLKGQFFVAMAQSWCIKVNDQMAKDRWDRSFHPLFEARVNGMMMNLPEFASEFKCKKNAPMNPEKKCTLF